MMVSYESGYDVEAAGAGAEDARAHAVRAMARRRSRMNANMVVPGPARNVVRLSLSPTGSVTQIGHGGGPGHEAVPCASGTIQFGGLNGAAQARCRGTFARRGDRSG